jgi:O-acetyl-ADP-ribose deacetylase (regulator of RNase III)
MLGIRRHRGASIDLWQGDLTTFVCDAMVNAANEALAGGGGIDGAIHRVGGPSLLAECRQHGRCPTGGAVATGAGDLPAKWVLHAVGPRWAGGSQGEADLLARAHDACLHLAEERGARHVAFPAISTGVYGYPVYAAAGVALQAVRAWLDARGDGKTAVRRITFALFSKEHYRAFQDVLFATFPESE